MLIKRRRNPHKCNVECLIKAGELRLRTAIEDEEPVDLIQFLQEDLETLKNSKAAQMRL